MSIIECLGLDTFERETGQDTPEISLFDHLIGSYHLWSVGHKEGEGERTGGSF
jgi:hypothetical protein